MSEWMFCRRGSPVARWVHGFAGAVVCEPVRFGDARAYASLSSLPLVLCVPASENAAAVVALRADAYASDEESLCAALAFLGRTRAQRPFVERRVTYLGSLGETRPLAAPVLGASIRLGAGVTILHTRVDPLDARTARVTNLHPRSGTYVDGERIDTLVISPGDEIAVAASHRFRLD